MFPTAGYARPELIYLSRIQVPAHPCNDVAKPRVGSGRAHLSLSDVM
jgi:hypothetical protein